MSETWLQIPGYGGAYEVSNVGRVRSLDRVLNQRDGTNRPIAGRILKQRRGPQGYWQVMISNKATLQKKQVRFIHRLVLEAFVGPRPEGMECRHLDDNPDNNTLENLRWGTRLENRADMLRNGKHYGKNLDRCKRDHPFDEVNTRVVGGTRWCRACDRIRQQKSKEKKLLMAVEEDAL